MKFKKFFVYLAFCLLITIIICPLAKGNPVIIELNYDHLITPGLYLLMFVLTINVEFLIIYNFLKRHIDKWSSLSKPILAANLFTFPSTQLLAIFFFSLFPFNFWNGLLIELFPITMESLLFIILYQNLQISVSNKTIVFSTIVANISSFILGLALSYALINVLW